MNLEWVSPITKMKKNFAIYRMIAGAALMLLSFSASAQYRYYFDLHHPGFLPIRDTAGLKEMREYEIDALTGEKKLVQTTRYDRHGYIADPTILTTYDEQGRLTCHRRVYDTYSSANPLVPKRWTSNVIHIEYDKAGLVCLFTDTIYWDLSDKVSQVACLKQIGTKSHPIGGVSEVEYQRSDTAYDEEGNVLHQFIDTITNKRLFDSKGQMVREEMTGDFWELAEPELRTYKYDSQGRLIERVGMYYECSDSMNYTYTATERIGSGFFYDLGLIGTVTERATLDGIPIETRYVWKGLLEEDDTEPGPVEVYTFNKKGSIVRYENTVLTNPPQTRIRIYEYDYWE